MKRILLYLSVLFFVSSCTTTSYTRGEQYSNLYEEKPLCLLVMPPINNSSYVEAKDLLYTSISKPLAESGYYIISPLLAMDILKAESAYDSEMFINGDISRFKQFFGADAVVFSEIETWTKRGFGIDTKIRYTIKSTTTNEILFERSCDLYLDLSVRANSNSGLVGLAVAAAVSAAKTAATDHIKAARMCNQYIFSDIPRGKYSPDYMQDKEVRAEKKDIKTTVKQ